MFRNYKLIIWIAFIVIVILTSSILFPILYTDNWEKRGQIGDSFNIVNSIATLIACVIGVITLFLYGMQITEQKREIIFGSKRQLEIENNLAEISLALKQITANSKSNLEIQSLLNIIEMKKNQIDKSKTFGLTRTAITNLEMEMNEHLNKLESLLKSL
jgi:hypothetical protein